MNELIKIKNKIKDLYYLKDDSILDLLLAVALSRGQKNGRIWLILVGNSSAGKTSLLELLNDREHAYTLGKITPNTLISGKPNKDKYPDLAPQLDNKLTLIPEYNEILTLPTEAKSEIFGQFRSLYDGKISRNVAGGRYEYKVNTCMIGCATHKLDSQILMHNDLGTRDLIYRTDSNDSEELINKVYENMYDESFDDKKEETKKAVCEFIRKTKFKEIKIEQGTEIWNRLIFWTDVARFLRVSVASDNNTGDLLDTPHIEERPRIFMQFLTLYKALKSLDENYSDEEAFSIIRKIALDSCNQKRVKIILDLMAHNYTNKTELSLREVSKLLNISKKVVNKELQILEHFDIVKNNETPIYEEREQYKFGYSINTNHWLVQFLSKEMNVPISLEIENINLNGVSA